MLEYNLLGSRQTLVQVTIVNYIIGRLSVADVRLVSSL